MSYLGVIATEHRHVLEDPVTRDLFIRAVNELEVEPLKREKKPKKTVRESLAADNHRKALSQGFKETGRHKGRSWIEATEQTAAQFKKSPEALEKGIARSRKKKKDK
ncbi:MAG: hypothetical protein J0I29_12415 [Rhizobiales bacterium]|nr:hypothetical protein [Hyphomicrobiales bacterium]